MKKYLSLLLVFVLTLVPVLLYAKEEEKTKIELDKYKTMDFAETLKDEEMELKNTSYSENDKQATIYLFRGRGCGYCRAFLTFLNDISEEYGEYFKVVSFETWYDEDNAKLLETVSNFLEQPASGVPYIVIGDQVFAGYAESYDDGIKTAIQNLYDNDEAYDVIEEYNDSIKFHLSDGDKLVLWNLFFIICASAGIIFYVKKSNEKIMEEIKKVSNNKVVATIKNDTDKVSKPVKKRNAKKK